MQSCFESSTTGHTVLLLYTSFLYKENALLDLHRLKIHRPPVLSARPVFATFRNYFFNSR